MALGVVACIGALAAVLAWEPKAPPAPRTTLAVETGPVAKAPGGPYIALLDPGFSLGSPPLPLGQNAPLAAEMRLTASADTAMLSARPWDAETPEPATPAPTVAALGAAPSETTLSAQPAPVTPTIVLVTPAPVPRPSDLDAPAKAEPPRIAASQAPRRRKVATASAAPEDNRSFFEKLFGVQRPTGAGTALAYAAPQDDVVDAGRGRRLSPLTAPGPVAAQATAVYDITARTVYMPNGERLEAHSGLGDKMDDPRFVHVRMQGATPPHVYNLTEREALFHGVRALRLNPVGGSGAIHGRAGLLTHTYLLGPNGDSNGCISFKDYDRFLQAYLRGEVKRLVVVAGRG